MTELVLSPSQLDIYIRDRITTVLIGKHTNTPRTLHLRSEEELLQPACGKHTQRDGNWLEKPVTVYPPGFHPFCGHCVSTRFDVEVIDNAE